MKIVIYYPELVLFLKSKLVVVCIYVTDFEASGGNLMEFQQEFNEPDKRTETSSQCESLQSGSNNNPDSSSGESMGSKKISPMAFTVDFSGTDGTNGVTTIPTKKFNISDSISKFAPRHRRNFSMTKAEDMIDKKEVTTAPMFSISTLSKQRNLRKGAESTNGVSSSSTSNKRYIAKSTPVVQEATASKLCSESNKKKVSEFFDMGKSIPAAQSVSGRNKGIESTRAKDLTVHLFSNDGTDKSYETEEKKVCSEEKRMKSYSADMVKDLNGNSGLDDGGDSETGTYTIEKDNPDPKVKEARKKIDKEFGVERKGEDDSRKPSLGRGSPGWIEEWAEMAAQQQEPSDEGKLFKSLITVSVREFELCLFEWF